MMIQPKGVKGFDASRPCYTPGPGRPRNAASLQGGATWSRFNDDAHQFGGIGVSAADQNVYGRIYFSGTGRGLLYSNRGHEIEGMQWCEASAGTFDDGLLARGVKPFVELGFSLKVMTTSNPDDLLLEGQHLAPAARGGQSRRG